MKFLSLFLAGLLLFTSCATVFTGSKKRVLIDGNVEGPVNLTIDGYRISNVELPYTHKIKGGLDDSRVKVEAEGYDSYMLVIEKSFNAVSIVNLLNVFGWAIDALTGAIMKPEYKQYEVYLKPVPADN